jgi:NADPH:quinone reductase-like Zn-dependent oxidoreductase
MTKPAPAPLPATMCAIVTTGNGGYDRLVYRQTAVPKPGSGEVLIEVAAAGVNNTDINTRIGWYDGGVTDGTSDVADAAAATVAGGWKGATPFPLIQGADCCGRVVASGDSANDPLIGARVLVRPCMRTGGFRSLDTVWLGTDFDGAFAQYVKVPRGEVFPVDCRWTDAELATVPCAWGTAENMLHRANVRAGETVLVTGASGGVGSATVQLARRRGATVIAVAGRDKHEAVRAIGATRCLDRTDDPEAVLGEDSIDVVVDNVAGPGFGSVLRTLKRGGRYASSGAIAGPVVSLDMRIFYLRDLTLIGCTAWDEPVFANLVSYIERGEVRPLLAATYPLKEIAAAQRDFLGKRHVGKIVVVPPPLLGEA